jgi:ABC-2 type transport system permease protein
VPSTWSIVARTEYVEGARSTWFVAVTALVPVLFGGMILLSVGLTSHVTDEVARLAIVDRSEPPIGDIVRTALEVPHGGKARFVVETLARDDDGASAAAPQRGQGNDGASAASPQRGQGNPGVSAALEARVASGELDGYLVLPPDATRGGHSLYRGTNASSLTLVPRLTGALRGAIIAGRAKSLGLRAEDVGTLLSDVTLDAEQANGGAKASGSATLAAGYSASFVLYISILLYGVTVARSVIHEKTSRVVEILVACARPWDLMVGKVVGVGALGLTQMGIWLGTALALTSVRGPLLARFGVKGAENVELPHLGGAELAIILVYFLGGYFLYASLFAAVGAACSTERDVQQTQLPVVLPLSAAFMCFPAVTSNPRGVSSVALTLVPFFSPVLMPLRCLLAPVPAWQLLTSVALLLATTAATTWFASRVYRVGILMFGKKPTLAEIARWIRTG